MNIVKKVFRFELASVVIPIVVLFIALVATSKGFLSAYNIVSLLQLAAIYLLIGLSQMSTLALGQFNLALGAMGSLSAVIMGYLMQLLGFPVIIAILIGLLFAAFLGWLQGVLIARSGINPFIITLALISVFSGIGAVITKGNAYKDLPDAITVINTTKFGSIPLTFVIAFVVCMIIFVVFRFTNIGKKLQAVGENAIAAKYSGINVKRTITIGHVMSGLLAGIAAVFQIAKFASAQTSIGDDWMMTSFVVTVLGGTLLSGGKVTTIGTLFGCFLMVLIKNALGIWGVNTFMFQAILGLVLLGAYEIDRTRLAIIRRQSDIINEAPTEGEENE